MKKKFKAEKLRVGSPCTQEWNEMDGNEQVRFCTHCSKDVHYLSAMTRRDATRLVRQSKGNLCIRYIQHPETQAPVFSDQLVQIARRLPRVAAGVMSASMSLATFAYAQGGSARPEKESCPLPQTGKPEMVERANISPKTNDQAPTSSLSDDRKVGWISGTVFDSQKAVIPGATVTLRDPEGNEIYRTGTDAEGHYEFRDISFAKYRLAGLAPGFRATTLELNIGGPAERVVDVTLNVGELISGGAIIARVEYKGELMVAVDDDDIEKARDLIAARADVNRQEEDGATPIFAAVANNNIEMVRLLLNSGAKVDERNDDKETLLMLIDEETPLELVDLLLRAGAKVNRADDDGNTVLIKAADNNVKTEVLQALINAGAELNAKNNDGVTALMEAAESESLESVRALILAGADINIRDNDGDNAWDYTTEEEIEDFLVSHGVILDPEDLEGAPDEDTENPDGEFVLKLPAVSDQ